MCMMRQPYNIMRAKQEAIFHVAQQVTLPHHFEALATRKQSCTFPIEANVCFHIKHTSALPWRHSAQHTDVQLHAHF